MTRPYLVAISAVCVAVLLLVVVATQVVFPRNWQNSEYRATYIIATLLAIILIVVPFDRFCEEQMNLLEKLPDDKA